MKSSVVGGVSRATLWAGIISFSDVGAGVPREWGWYRWTHTLGRRRMKGLEFGLIRSKCVQTEPVALVFVRGNHSGLLANLRRLSFLEDRRIGVGNAVVDVVEPLRDRVRRHRGRYCCSIVLVLEAL